MKKILLVGCFISSVLTGYAQEFRFADSHIFKPQNKVISLFKNSSQKEIILFKTNMAINTDGTPLSYHPYDLRADSIALNYITNGVAIYRLSDSRCISIPKKEIDEYPKRFKSKVKFDPDRITDTEKKEFIRLAYSVFEQWRDKGYPKEQIEGYEIIWQNVLVNDNGTPCIFTKNKRFAGFYGSMTAEKNGIVKDSSECKCANQVDPFKIPSIVLNDKIKYGAALGDLVVAYNPANSKIVYGIIADEGPGDNLGEGSILMNMKLTGASIPDGQNAVKSLAVKDKIIICIVPKSRKFQLARPYTEENIKNRVLSWFVGEGYATESDIIKMLEKNSL